LTELAVPAGTKADEVVRCEVMPLAGCPVPCELFVLTKTGMTAVQNTNTAIARTTALKNIRLDGMAFSVHSRKKVVDTSPDKIPLEYEQIISNNEESSGGISVALRVPEASPSPCEN
jgi:hypothetical protein